MNRGIIEVLSGIIGAIRIVYEKIQKKKAVDYRASINNDASSVFIEKFGGKSKQESVASTSPNTRIEQNNNS